MPGPLGVHTLAGGALSLRLAATAGVTVLWVSGALAFGLAESAGRLRLLPPVEHPFFLAPASRARLLVTTWTSLAR
ncbi:hypothetical protein [Streptomyces sp. NRRL B-24484]|uniref:hypothetical protein n=1 Tax=Streptomyces sp. NRRL B-24484 TaxID=1463833 RepID=UPI000B2F2DEC|nr:hypothetical protein [Streptomyces sp. NRRL B-24484]